MATTRAVVLGLALLVVGCNPARVVVPLSEGETRIDAHLGGPLIYFANLPIALPLSSVGVAHGIDSNLTYFGAIHLTSLAYGVVQIEQSVILSPWQKERVGLSLSPGFHAMFDIWESNFKLYPTLDANLWRSYGTRGSFVYGGAGTWLELAAQRAHGETQEGRWAPYFQLGHVFKAGKWAIQTEMKWIQPNASNQNIVVEYISPSNRGALGFYLSFAKSIGN